MIDQLYSPEHGHEGLWAPLSMWRTIWHANMEFSTLGRFDDIVHLRRHAVTILLEPKPHLLVHFMGGKTDIFSEGSERLVCSHTPSDHYCPVHLTEMYFLRLGVTYLGYLVPRTKLISGVLVADPNQPLSYTTALEDLRDILTRLGLDASEYGEHSGKRGGATAAAASGMPVEELQRLGGWRSTRMPSVNTDLDTTSHLQRASALIRKRL